MRATGSCCIVAALSLGHRRIPRARLNISKPFWLSISRTTHKPLSTWTNTGKRRRVKQSPGEHLQRFRSTIATTPADTLRFLTRLRTTNQEHWHRRVRNWKPADYGQARMAAIGCLCDYDKRPHNKNEVDQAIHAAAAADDADDNAIWDKYYLAKLRIDTGSVYQAALQLSRRNSLPGHYALVRTLANRRKAKLNKRTALKAENVDQALLAYRAVRSQQPTWNVTAYTNDLYQDLSEISDQDRANAFYDEVKADSRSVIHKLQLLAMAQSLDRSDDVLTLLTEIPSGLSQCSDRPICVRFGRATATGGAGEIRQRACRQRSR